MSARCLQRRALGMTRSELAVIQPRRVREGSANERDWDLGVSGRNLQVFSLKGRAHVTCETGQVALPLSLRDLQVITASTRNSRPRMLHLPAHVSLLFNGHSVFSDRLHHTEGNSSIAPGDTSATSFCRAFIVGKRCLSVFLDLKASLRFACVHRVSTRATSKVHPGPKKWGRHFGPLSWPC